MTAILTQRPRTSGRFSALMDVYERNYMLMRLLAPRLRDMTGESIISNADDALPLEIVDLEHSRYTSTFRLTYQLSARHRPGREPNLAIRLYHDARTCEVMSGLLPDQPDQERRTRDLDEGIELNLFLYRWLSYCLRQGHGFDGARRQARKRARAVT